MKEDVAIFDRDAREQGGYGYTSTQRLSSRLATERAAAVILESGALAGRKVIDVGCGDGFYTIQFWDKARPESLVAIDGAGSAVEVARRNAADRGIVFAVADAHHLPHADNAFDVALIQAILHHDDDPGDLIREAFRLAPEIVILEPNGNNPGLKIIEKLSSYHRLHNERSYSTSRMRAWIEDAGGEVVRQRFAGFVAMFSPDWLARGMKAIEPLVEHTPILRSFGCAIYLITARRKGAGPLAGEVA